jgi:hypothetical protein
MALDRVARVDQVLMLLKKQLAARTQAGRSPGARTAPQADASQVGPLDQTLVGRLGELRASGLGDRSRLARVVIEGILIAEFGPDMLNDVQFQKVVADIHGLIAEDPELNQLINRLLDQ